ncbi:MAG: tRNA pseudouridine(38-40) synthase TruA [Candidatus Omnitrophica bacterium]|nr:tRNA pseudouridine(38-40) synthase TruA [Candidatus Omnitrophota bacterium]MCF7894527.1 tRNA pseudouridine(38-40) synthase TruA [Candidatus Omnitrophota bacterium]
MEKNIFFEIEYVGTNYFGFQVQNKENKKEVTIQSIFEKVLSKLFCQSIKINASGRTDRGVHAKAHPLNFKVNTEIPLKNIKKAINSFLPSDIRVKKVKLVALDFHSRFSAKSKIYRYIILNQKEFSVFWSKFSWHFAKQLNIGLMRQAGEKLIGLKDFYIFTKETKKYRNCVRNLKKISINKKRNFIYIDIEANGFLYQMARNIVYFLTDVGSKKITINQIEGILSRKIKFIKKPAPSWGLYLKQVKYQ